jgi:hypothetical protein
MPFKAFDSGVPQQPSSPMSSEQQAWQVHEEVRGLVRQHLANTRHDHVLSPALLADSLKRLIEQVTGAPAPTATPEEEVRPVFGKRLQ